MSVLAPHIKKQYFDSSGNPLVGGKLNIYEAGTTTRANSYTTKVADVANPNPIVLDARGELGALYLVNGSYKFELTDADDVVIWTQDNVEIRDVGAELDSLQSSVTSINNTIASAEIPTRLISGLKSANSGAPRFLQPVGTTNQVRILADTTNLQYIIQDVTYQMIADRVYSGFVSAPTTNNTALVNNSNLSGQDYTKTMGEFGSTIPYDTDGSEISSRDGELHAFKIAGTSVEYFLGRIDNTNKVLRNCKRGCFLDQNSIPVSRTTFSDNDVITIMRLGWLYLGSDETVLVSYTEPTYSSTEHTSPLDGDMWYDLTNQVWKRFESTSYQEKLVTPVGLCVQDENGNTVAAKAFPFFKEWNDENTIGIAYNDSSSVRAIERDNRISVNGTLIQMRESTSEWNIVNNIESGEIESASTRYYCYVKENGDTVISPHAPTDEMGKLKGYYHPFEMWRFIGSFYNNTSSNIDKLSVRSSLDFKSNSLGSVGEIRTSMLDEVMFQTQMDETWVLMDGRSVAGSFYEQLTGLSTLPDARGQFLRGKNNGRNDGDQDPAGERVLGNYQADAMQGHHHAVEVSNVINAGSGGGAGGSSAYGTDVQEVLNPTSDGVNGTPRTDNETRPKNIAINYFIKVN